MIEGLELVKDRPLAPGHRLELYVEPGRKKDRSAEALCTCDLDRRLSTGSAARAQAVLDAAARSHGSELTFGDYRLSRLLETLELELRYLDVDEILERYGRPLPIETVIRARLEAEFAHRLWTEEPRIRRTPRIHS